MKTKHIFLATVLTLGLVTLGLELRTLSAQTPGEWTWMHGDNTPNSPGVFGIQGVANSTNKPPALYEPCEWTDNNGNFWLFGGSQSPIVSNAYAALWKYDPTTNEWTWMKGPSTTNQFGVYGTQGVPSPVNFPCSRGYGVVTWVDASGNLWLFGGGTYIFVGGKMLNDLWKYDIASNQWTWMKGPNTANDPGYYGTQGVPGPLTLPPSRAVTSCSWTDNAGNLWLYGGGGTGIGIYGDLWRYNISTNQWTWMHGANTGNAPPVYGTQGVTDPANMPGGRYVYCSWTDLAGNLWLFGGMMSGASSVLNDLWKYDIAANQWTWMKGPNTTNDPGNYGTKCVPAITNMPPARWENRAQVRDACGNFWNFGGIASAAGNLIFNDLWHYNVSTNRWTWVSGDNTPNQAVVYGTLGVSAPSNKPGARYGSVAWMDNKGSIWVFGGRSNGNYNDLFRYVPDSACVPVCNSILSAAVTSTNVFCNGYCTGTATATPINGTSPYTYLWDTTPAQTTQIATGLCAGAYTVTVSDAANSSATATVTITQPPVFTTTAAAAPANIISGASTTLSATGGGTYQWSPSNGLSCATCQNPVAMPTVTTMYCVTVTNANNCTDTACVTVTVIAEPLDCSTAGELFLPNAFSPNNDGENDKLQIYYGDIKCIKSLKLVIYNRWGEKVFETTNPAAEWDGTFTGKVEGTATFVYYMEATMIDGKEFFLNGNISLIR